ncbi:hypothetical protein A6046_03265 [[Haemophilus] ducreyi]|uniref:Uncharacterized protein n=2 Tax=Haemophilus ducreyi TaxID=730 RepID=Q7VPH1_HAEDU|nr:hypothetical protein [[Haemophilus] ducreyi]AAP95110.1 hypothetical protein HD_0107 [[Haemophilus] ducreyi 35000HP]AKO30286.1 hypothetical protein RY60_00415 [[Haemophilus] ducreyi]AKO31719.1 hypothetical protein RZ57_00420 [[Haemophilus] ducreyi]AKO33172.1 hypothetical protein RZ58_00420 [[Haemophilus] ducreyi]AKO34621.1 hypothetical protein RZ59_00415 [[Haemophilus] ducreyi]
MKCKCPACGAINSLDALVANEKAGEAIALALSFNGELGKALISYLGLFRPEKSALSFDRVAVILGELLPCVQAGEIKRDGKTYPAPVEAWIYAINSMLASRHNLKLPMKNHGYLFEIISRWQGQSAVKSTAVSAQTAPKSNTMRVIKGIGEWMNNG